MSESADWIIWKECPEMIAWAKKRQQTMAELCPRGMASQRVLTLVYGEHDLTGARGEWALRQEVKRNGILPLESQIFKEHGDEYDLILPRVGLIDCKTKAMGEVRKSHKTVDLAAHQVSKSDVYVFCHWHSLERVVYLLGWMPRLTYLRESRFCRQGERVDGCVVKGDEYMGQVADLFPIRDLFSICRGKK
jgi:hypothetical protein